MGSPRVLAESHSQAPRHRAEPRQRPSSQLGRYADVHWFGMSGDRAARLAQRSAMSPDATPVTCRSGRTSSGDGRSAGTPSSNNEGQEDQANREGDRADREPERPVVLVASRREDLDQKVRPKPTNAGKDAGEGGEVVRGATDDGDGEQEKEQCAHGPEVQHHRSHAPKNECDDPEPSSVHAVILPVMCLWDGTVLSSRSLVKDFSSAEGSRHG